MEAQIYQTLDLIRSSASHAAAWQGLVAVCEQAAPSVPWELLPTPDIERDVDAAANWLAAQLGALPGVSGLYLGLDTLNMGDGAGENVELGRTTECDPALEEVDWVYDAELDSGAGHGIRGLAELHAVYSGEEWEAAFEVCDYLLVLGYSGLVLAEALERVNTHGHAVLAVWGFHDGDLFLLCRATPTGFERLCRLPDAA